MDWGFFKRHPYITGGVVIFGGFLFFSLSRGGSSQGTAVNSGPTDAQIAANTQLQLGQLALNAKSTEYATALEAHRLDTSAAIELGSQRHDIEALTVAAQQALGFAAIDSQNKTTATQLEAIRLQNQTALEGARIQAQTIAQGYQLQSQVANEQYALEYHNQNVQSDRDAFAYQLQYQSNQYAYDLTQSLITQLQPKAA